ncbi:hypothetical protein RNAN_1260 [Rheinheimera nanhaiensis E407-8]|uniref:Uncharacterized protein n=1 Tax=Rheinheimera nanhaiensis E407-8 TaxID=562729 RepID=I1DW61_9GAMM|nr:hypothetical protein RNAN_1260 [Rheinheimera nanhaiensis E407-8]
MPILPSDLPLNCDGFALAQKNAGQGRRYVGLKRLSGRRARRICSSSL